ncbi:unnamed protein product [Schistosoma margrebowiei]|uniref:Uncharacterized protein n=1 Tax=Schistosoma margrebowiei TaxID=48269 RepID=A0A183LHK3_9TREM|nr:unnamed protein product [Schistosoma margrebowiei]
MDLSKFFPSILNSTIACENTRDFNGTESNVNIRNQIKVRTSSNLKTIRKFLFGTFQPIK